MQRDTKLVSYDIVNTNGKPYVSVDMGGQKKASRFELQGLRRWHLLANYSKRVVSVLSCDSIWRSLA